jgi:pSer/pThr/pTyr-binding forkhead associated (FHA) protein
MRLELRVFGSSKDGSDVFTIGAIQVSSDKLLIGRDPECHYRPNSSEVSRHHCVIIRDEHTVRIRDMGSKNGTFVNSRRVQGDVVLDDGDIIQVGEIQLQIEIQAADSNDQTQVGSTFALDLSKQRDADDANIRTQ